MSKPKAVQLKNIATFINGYAFKPSEWSSNGLPIIRIQNLTNTSDTMNRYEGEYRPQFLVNDGDILISWSASLGVYEWSGGKALLNQHIFKVVFDKVTVDKRYFVHAITYLLDEMQGETHGSTMKHITKERFDKLEIPLPPIQEQIKIAATLDAVSDLIRLRKRQLEELDLLVKARFVEMFGDPETNPYQWSVVKISTVTGADVTNGFFAKRDAYVPDGNVGVLGVANIVNRMYSRCNDLPRTNGTDEDIRKYEVSYGDMLFCRSSLVAEGIGKASIVPSDVPKKTLFECHVIRLPLDLSKCIPEFLQVLSAMDFFRKQVIAQAKTSTMTTISQEGILKSMIILPPMSKQLHFVTFVKQIEKSKSEVQKAIEGLETLNMALISKYFG